MKIQIDFESDDIKTLAEHGVSLIPISDKEGNKLSLDLEGFLTHLCRNEIHRLAQLGFADMENHEERFKLMAEKVRKQKK